MAHQRFHTVRLRDRILGHLAKSYPKGHSASIVYGMLQQERGLCVWSAVYKALDAMVGERWLTPPKVAVDSDVGTIIDDVLEDHQKGTFRTKIACVGYRLTRNGMLAAHVSLARIALDRGDLKAVEAWLTRLQYRLTRNVPKDGPIAFPGHSLVVSRRDHAHLRARLRKPSTGPNAALRAAAKRFKRDVAAGRLAIHPDPAAGSSRVRAPH